MTPPRAARPQAQITRRETLDALKRSGYLLESRLESILRKAEFRVEANTLIPDTSGQRRELDLWAGWARCYEFGPKQNGMLSMELVIECVNPPQPIAFITKERLEPFFERVDRWEALKLMGSPVEVGSAPHDPWSWLASGLDVKRYHHYNAKRVSTQYCSFQKKQNSPDWMALHREEDHQTIKKLCYATNHFVRDAVNLSQVQDSDWTLTLIYPVLVIQGSIYDVRPLKRSARAVQTQHVQYYCTHEMNGEDTPYQIDVVTEKYFPSYLAMLFREMRLMHKRLVNKHEELTALYRLRRTNFLRYQQTLNVQKAPA